MSKFVIETDEKGTCEAIKDFIKGKSTFIKEGSGNIKAIQSVLEAYQKLHHSFGGYLEVA